MKRLDIVLYMGIAMLAAIAGQILCRSAAEHRNVRKEMKDRQWKKILDEWKHEGQRKKREIYVTFQDRAMATCIGMCMYHERSTYFQCETRCRIGSPLDPTYLSSEGWDEDPGNGPSHPVLLDKDSHRSLIRNIQTPQLSDNRRHDDIEDRHVIDI